jgi:glutathione S-transferase
MKFYYSPGACSHASHIALFESGIKFEAEAIDKKTKKLKDGRDFWKVNPKGYIPALETDKGVLAEGVAIMQYVAEQAPAKNLMPKAGSWDHNKAQEWMNYIATEMHKGMSPLFNKDLPDSYKTTIKENLNKKFDFLTTQLTGKDFIFGNQFTVCDAYLYTILGWTKHLGIDLSKWPALMSYVEKVKMRPSVQAAIKAEGLNAH